LRIVLEEINIIYIPQTLKLLLPIGISFYTFKVLSYLIDVYRGERNAERHLGLFAVFVAFFPQLAAGPIDRSKDLLPQFSEKHEIDYHRITDGLKLIAWGLFKKIIIADRIAVYVDQIFKYPDQYVGAPALLASVFFTIQVYCDFSGYSDIAIGSAQILGFRLMQNFDRPYHAKSVSEFWRRWHISLSTWLRDYIYNPLLISTRDWGLKAIIFSLLISFLACGLWHGADWTFIIFGLLHGLVLSLEVVTKKGRKKLKKIVPAIIYDNVCMVLTFSFVCFTFIFFRSNTVSDAFIIMKNIIAIDFTNLSITVPQMSRIELTVAFFSIAILESVQLIQRRVEVRKFIEGKKLLFRWFLYITFISYILFFRVSGVKFIYFQF
jgi:D-alanyl-lipoteichoic acid acyltransferase DltB (MBOAT superfamily)